MKNYFILILLFILTSKLLICETPFRLARLGTDFNGVIEANGRILAYGNYGVITFSDDLGETWKQINLGDFNHILKIVKDEQNNLYALAPKTIFLSKDNGNSWTQKTIFTDEDMLDFAIKDSTIYFITQNSIGSIDNEFKTEPQTFITFDEFSILSKCEVLDRYLFVVESNYYIYRIDINSKEIDTIDVHSKLNFSSYFRDIGNIKRRGNELYVLIKSSLSTVFWLEYKQKRHLIAKSTDFGDNWEVVTTDLPITLDFLINEDTISTLAPIFLQSYFGLSFVKIKGNEFVEFIQDTTAGIYLSYYEIAGLTPSFLNNYSITGITQVQESRNVIVAVGNNKTIFVSKNNGVNWEMKSFFRPIVEGNFPFYGYGLRQYGKDTIIVATNFSPNLFRSTDGGATFLPILNRTLNLIMNNLKAVLVPIFLSDGTIALVGLKPFTIEKTIYYQSDTIISIFSSNVFNSFSKVEIPLGKRIFNVDPVLSVIINTYVLRNKKLFLIELFLFRSFQDTTYPIKFLCLFNNKVELLDTIPLYKYYNTFADDNGLLLIDKGTLFSSADYGKTIIKLTDLPTINTENIWYKILGVEGSKIFINEYSKNHSRLLIFNLKTNIFDSLNLMTSSSSYYMQNLNDTILFIGDSGIYVFPDIMNDFSFEFYPFNELIPGSKNMTKITKFVETEKGNYIVSLMTFLQRFDFNDYHQINIGKVEFSEPSLVVEPEVEKPLDYLYASLPFPNPAKDWLNIKVFWDSKNLNQNVSLKIFDIFGREYNIPWEFSDSGQNSALVKINTASLSLGTYYLCINYGNRNIVIPLVILK